MDGFSFMRGANYGRRSLTTIRVTDHFALSKDEHLQRGSVATSGLLLWLLDGRTKVQSLPCCGPVGEAEGLFKWFAGMHALSTANHFLLDN